jgi:wee1-like protein kinase
MHEHNMVHLDIKPDNLLMKEGEVKVADLGLCRITRIKRWTDLDEGDSRYLAKEVLNYSQGVDLKKSDIYSLGMSIFQGAILEDLPNNGEEWLRIREQGINFKAIPHMSHYSAEFQSILSSMLRVNWTERASCEELLGGKYFGEQNNKRLSRFLRGTGNSSRKMEGSL